MNENLVLQYIFNYPILDHKERIDTIQEPAWKLFPKIINKMGKFSGEKRKRAGEEEDVDELDARLAAYGTYRISRNRFHF